MFKRQNLVSFENIHEAGFGGAVPKKSTSALSTYTPWMSPLVLNVFNTCCPI